MDGDGLKGEKGSYTCYSTTTKVGDLDALDWQCLYHTLFYKTHGNGKQLFNGKRQTTIGTGSQKREGKVKMNEKSAFLNSYFQTHKYTPGGV